MYCLCWINFDTRVMSDVASFDISFAICLLFLVQRQILGWLFLYLLRPVCHMQIIIILFRVNSDVLLHCLLTGFPLDLGSQVVVLWSMNFTPEKFQILFIWSLMLDLLMEGLQSKPLSLLICLLEINNLPHNFKKFHWTLAWLKLSVLDVGFLHWHLDFDSVFTCHTHMNLGSKALDRNLGIIWGC